MPPCSRPETSYESLRLLASLHRSGKIQRLKCVKLLIAGLDTQALTDLGHSALIGLMEGQGHLKGLLLYGRRAPALTGTNSCRFQPSTGLLPDKIAFRLREDAGDVE
jgi:hypothetical protein